MARGNRYIARRACVAADQIGARQKCVSKGVGNHGMHGSHGMESAVAAVTVDDFLDGVDEMLISMLAP